MTKLTWIELRKAIANHVGSSEKETAAFLNALITQIQNGLKEDRQVRITGLGIFRLQEVSPRKSVDVTTGEAIVIPGYNKIIFLPEVG
ncbi:MAG: HU family DNA-binding protein, partial [Paludibacteraceae bacterium]|nr:HU family DNA-binding protein [Paludibacteraceae bacterium]